MDIDRHSSAHATMNQTEFHWDFVKGFSQQAANERSIIDPHIRHTMFFFLADLIKKRRDFQHFPDQIPIALDLSGPFGLRYRYHRKGTNAGEEVWTEPAEVWIDGFPGFPGRFDGFFL